jgi:hypothetical protein
MDALALTLRIRMSRKLVIRIVVIVLVVFGGWRTGTYIA